ncbi:unnamed protein product [Caenorhabditis auriculariae]|uniref:Uncharacterized protein n=1 Tax=Caenorhabditis auriculariae TaxID=2777116 RepID=A0A8S1HTH5_9PELO|nr:unnamed protein product [Caenorhabditis auriculariae]
MDMMVRVNEVLDGEDWAYENSMFCGSWTFFPCEEDRITRHLKREYGAHPEKACHDFYCPSSYRNLPFDARDLPLGMRL